MKIEGIEELVKKFEKLKGAAQGRTMRQAANFAMTPVQKTASQLAPKGDTVHKTYKGRFVAPGFLSRNIKKKVYYSKSKGIAVAKVGMASEAFYGIFLHPENKRKQRKVPFLSKAYDENSSIIVNRFKDKLGKAILKEARK